MITFLAIDGLLFVTVLVLIELRLWEKLRDFWCSLYPTSIEECSKPWNLIDVSTETILFICFFFRNLANIEDGKVIPVEDDDVARERELIQSKPIAVLQKENNLVIK